MGVDPVRSHAHPLPLLSPDDATGGSLPEGERRLSIGYLCQMGVPDFASEPPTGPALHVRYVVEALRARGHRVRPVIVRDGRATLSDDLLHAEPIPRRHDRRSLLGRIERALRWVQGRLGLPYLALFEARHFADAVEDALGEVDLLYERAGWMGFGGVLAARRLGVPLVLEVNGDHLPELEMAGIAPRGLQRWLSSRLTAWAARAATLIVATGEGWRRSYIDRWGVDPARIHVVENGTDLVARLDRTRLANVADETPERAVTAVYVGGFDRWQGLPGLLRAVARVVADGAPLRLRLIGDGPLRAELERLIDSLALGGVVQITGWLDRSALAAELERAAIGISAYCGRVEYSGLKLLDYKAAGLATIASGEGGEPAVIGDGHTGLIVPPCDEEALATALARLVADGALRRRLGRAARQEAERHHGWDATVRRIEALLYPMLDARAGVAA